MPHRLALAGILVLVGLTAPALARQIEVTGRVEVIQIDDFDHGQSRVVHKVRDERSGREYELDGAPAGLRHGMRIRANGKVLRGVRRDHARVLVQTGDGTLSLTVLDAPMVAAALVVGQRKAIVMVVDFTQDGKTVACSDAAITGSMFTGNPSVDKLYQEASFNQLSWPADTNGNGVPDVVRVAINDAGNDCDTGTWRSLADSAATAAGMNLGLYQHRVYVLPSSVACSWAGYAQIGCGSACWSMVSTCDRGDVYAHELGHNLGMYHASFDADNNGAVDGTCPWGGWSGGGEYCDDSDFMGISTNVWRQTNGPHKDQMGWLPADKVVTVTTSGTYGLAPLETAPGTTALPLLLRVARPASGGYYYLSFRRRIGYDANMRLDYADRTSIHKSPGGNTLLVKFLADGQSFSDPTNGMTITQSGHDTSAAQVTVSMSCGNGVLDPGEQCDGANLGSTTCGGCAGTPRCTSSCTIDTSTCTNGVCDATETCAGCPADCAATDAACGNGVCEAGNGETCVSCPADCAGRQGGKPSARFCCGFGGPNPIGCDANRCGACTTQVIDVCCGDGQCNGGETNATCSRDCFPCTDADGDGYCPSQGDCNDANPTIRPNAVEACSGGVDENCNGLVDCNDPACATSPSCTTCSPLGASCTQNGQCCSLSCGGKPNRKTCR
ncbi:MAG: MopE-related protein [Candidatus Binatia bacterium]